MLKIFTAYIVINTCILFDEYGVREKSQYHGKYLIIPVISLFKDVANIISNLEVFEYHVYCGTLFKV